jgi:uncharacterized membrane protein YjjP (DUF1212 family)
MRGNGGTAVNLTRHSLLRDIIAVVVVAVACPVAVFGGANLGCVGSAQFNSSCALSVIFISPIVLLIAGAIAGIASRGWTGFLLVFIATVIGMTSILALSYVGGTPVPLDPISAFIATIWFFAPIAVGYGIGRLVTRLWASRSGDQRRR